MEWLPWVGLVIGSGGLVQFLNWYSARKQSSSDSLSKRRKDAIEGFEFLTNQLQEEKDRQRRDLLEEMDRRMQLAKDECNNEIARLRRDHDRELSDVGRTARNLRDRVVTLERQVVALGGNPNDD